MNFTSTPSSVSGAKEMPNVDIEQGSIAGGHLRNTTVHNLAWKGVTVTVKDRETKLPKTIVDNVEGIVEAGELFTYPLSPSPYPLFNPNNPVSQPK